MSGSALVSANRETEEARGSVAWLANGESVEVPLASANRDNDEDFGPFFGTDRARGSKGNGGGRSEASPGASTQTERERERERGRVCESPCQGSSIHRKKRTLKLEIEARHFPSVATIAQTREWSLLSASYLCRDC
ncbi:hypothetical protein MA16_Dca023454 [Dendrobium catenatum]|uniref:Uncharacterized protein n=1 Tax=Dendrobium catenatum TaxID=906689 RepID=A0A2I0VKT2_9ASPA|nr:hypothetical protein MA16_Dca023454 [Dendrobium catenatum]